MRFRIEIPLQGSRLQQKIYFGQHSKYHLRTMHGEHVILEFRHLKKHGETAHNCPLCLVQFKSFYNMHRHILDHHSKEERKLLKTEGGLCDPKYKCTRCEKSFVTESILEKHIERAHKNKSPDATKSGESWACNYCTEIFPTCSLVQAHTVKAHKKKYQCKDPLMLKYECVLCRNKFRKNKYLRNHQENIIIILVNVMIKGAFANKRGRRVPQTLKDSAACVANVAS